MQQPELYFQRSLKMQYGVYPDTDIVYFSGRLDNTIVALIGSLEHVEGARPIQTLSRSSWGSIAVGVTRNLVKELNLSPTINRYKSNVEETDAYPLGQIVGEAHRLIEGPTAEVEFVAIRMHEGHFENRQTLLGTPFYVAYAT